MNFKAPKTRRSNAKLNERERMSENSEIDLEKNHGEWYNGEVKLNVEVQCTTLH